MLKSLVIRKKQIKVTATTTHAIEWLKQKIKKLPVLNKGEDVE